MQTNGTPGRSPSTAFNGAAREVDGWQPIGLLPQSDRRVPYRSFMVQLLAHSISYLIRALPVI